MSEHPLSLTRRSFVFGISAWLEMKASGLVDSGTDLQNPNLAKMAETAGLMGLTAETPDQIRPTIRRCPGT
jgi:thiamine pyrophosphate-dependent acetolactate synthase large subunit-like protein